MGVSLFGAAQRREMWERPGRSPNPSSSGSSSGSSPESAASGEAVQRDLKRQALLQDLSRRLAGVDGPERVQAAREIRKMARVSLRARSAFAVGAVVGPLVGMLLAPEREEREAALLALLNLAVRNERNKTTIVKFGAVLPLIQLLKSEGCGLRELAGAAILTLSAAESNRSVISASGAGPLLVQVLISGTIQGKVDAVTALYNLSSGKESLQPHIYVNAAGPLFALLKDSKKYSKFAEKACSLLESLSSIEEGKSAISEVEGGILTMVETVEDGSYLSMEYAAGVLLALCRSCRSKYRERILQEGAIPGLLRLTVYGSKKGQERARELLNILRDDRPPRLTSRILETIAFDIASRVDGPSQAAETAKRLLKDMVRRERELSGSHRRLEPGVPPPASMVPS